MVFRDLLTVLFAPEEARLGAAFPPMLDLAFGMFEDVHGALWADGVPDGLRADIYARDVRLNQLERSLRKDALVHLSCGFTQDVPFCFALANVVKDAERIGDYVKNLMDPVADPRVVPEGPLRDAMEEMAGEVRDLLGKVRPVYEEGLTKEAEALVRHGRSLAARCDGLVSEISTSELPSRATTALTLLARFYKRVAAHATNILSSVIMPVHKIDYFDEDALPGDED